MSLRILNFHAENIKKLVVVDITPDGNLQIIGGKNSQGKSSVLDAIFLALAGGDASKAIKKPVRDGEDYAVVRLDLGEYVVTREWKGDKSTLKVEAANGAKFSSPQNLLDSLLGRLAFDPLEFMRLAPKDQKDALLDLVHLDINLEALEIQRQNAYDERTEIGRTVKSLEGLLAGLGEVEEAPEEPVSVGGLVTRYDDARKQWGYKESLEQQITASYTDIVRCEAIISDQKRVIEESNARLNELTIENFDGLKVMIDSADETNNKVRRNQERLAAADKLLVAKAERDIQSTAIAMLDEAKSDALAKAVFPVPDLSFFGEGVTYKGNPLDQASDSEKITISLAMAMALNPTIRVIRINGGSLWDAGNLQLISEMAKDKDYQIFLETVGDNGVGIIMEAGEVKTDYSKAVAG